MKKTILIYGRQIVVVAVSMLLYACSSSEDELSRYIHSVKNRPSKPIEPIPEFKPLAKFVFPADDKRRSPFKPIEHETQTDINSPDTKRLKQPLEAFPLDALKFVGILKQGQNIWGLILQPGGAVNRVHLGEYMGKNYGQIIRIRDNAIDIEESVQVGGRWEKRKITLNLHSLD